MYLQRDVCKTHTHNITFLISAILLISHYLNVSQIDLTPGKPHAPEWKVITGAYLHVALFGQARGLGVALGINDQNPVGTRFQWYLVSMDMFIWDTY